MSRKNLGKLLLIILILLSGCSTVEKSKEQTSVSESKLQETNEVSSTENATNTIESLATSSNNKVKQVAPKAEMVFLTIDFGAEKKSAQVEFEEGTTVFDILQAGTKKLGLDLATQTYSIGVFINSIGDKKNGQENYWTYYVNDKFAQVAADKYKLKAGDRVEWKFSQL
jgi:putative ubiquitin-RnfH superfamily antitoxin RatB of RatAB toxin-antitoxin module